MNAIVMLIAIMAAMLIENVLPGWSAYFHVKAPVLMGIVIYYALNRSLGLALAAAVVGGILYDGLCGLPPGCSVITMALFVALFRRNREFLFGDRFLTQMVVGALAGGVFAVLTGVGVALLPGPGGGRMPAHLMPRVFGMGIMGMASFPLVFRVMLRLDRMVGNTHAGESTA